MESELSTGAFGSCRSTSLPCLPIMCRRINKETIIRESQITVDVEESLHLTCILYVHWPVLVPYVLLSSYTQIHRVCTAREPQALTPHVPLLSF